MPPDENADGGTQNPSTGDASKVHSVPLSACCSSSGLFSMRVEAWKWKNNMFMSFFPKKKLQQRQSLNQNCIFRRFLRMLNTSGSNIAFHPQLLGIF